MLNQFQDSDVGSVLAYIDDSNGKQITVLDFYGIHGDIMGSLAACVGLLAALVLSFAACGAFSIGFIRHSTR